MKIHFGRNTKSISNKSGNGQSPGCLILFGLIFLIVGICITYFLAVVPLLKWQAAQNWKAVPCTITNSRVDSRSDEDGTTYKAVIHFQFTYQGQQYTGNNYNFDKSFSSGRSGKQAIVLRYPVDSETICYVKPSDPAQAVISRDFSWTYLLGFFGLIFFAFGLVITISPMRASKQKTSISARGKRSLSRRPITSQDNGGPITLKPTTSPLKKLGIICFFALFWNGISWTIFLVMLADMKQGVTWFPLIFISIFLLVGLLLVFFVIHQLLALFNPRPRLSLSESRIPLGSTVEMSWTFEGSIQRMHSLKIWVQGREEATYRQGTDTRTVTKLFEKIPIIESSHTADMATGQVQFTIPEFTMHSFEASRNKIIWSIHVHGDIPKWPDIQEEFPITVTPLQTEG